MTGPATEILFNVDGSLNQIYVATTNPYVYRPLGTGSLTSTPLQAPGTPITIPTLAVVVAQGTCSASTSINISGSSSTRTGSVLIVPTLTTGIYYQNSGNNVSYAEIVRSSTSTSLVICAENNASPGIFDIALTMDGPDKKLFYLNNG